MPRWFYVSLCTIPLITGCAHLSGQNLGGPRTVAFRMHTLNAESRYEGAGAFDVNRDGRLDVFCGGFWYEAPSWTRHFVREIKEQDNYYYDFAALPLDVDGDGWTDVVSGAWHNKRLFWVRNPGTGPGPWEEIAIDEPGNIETVMLADINRDGRMDVLPNVFGAPAWYSPARSAPGKENVRWDKHELPKELAGPGVGAGDINNDGLTDVVGAKGWAEQTRDGTWRWHAEFDLVDPGIPILIHDVDGDGDMDLVWGIGHNYGLYWLEQEQSVLGQRTWAKHEIDRSWSQAHVTLLGDLDNDGQLELVTGKRYYAHNGKDPGANDPRCLYYYRFDRARRVWSRHTIHEGGPAGVGTATQLVDIDADGDLDLIAPGKSGLYLFENLYVH